MLDRVIYKFIEAGITHIVVNVHHHADMVKRHIATLTLPEGVSVNISDETSTLLDTGGGLLKAAPLFEGFDNIVLHNADILTDVDLRAMIGTHTAAGSDVTLLVSQRKTSRYLYFNSDMLLCGWKNLKTEAVLPEGFNPDGPEKVSPFAFGGIHVLKTSVLKDLREYAPSDVFSIIPFYASCCGKLSIRGYVPQQEYNWMDIGTPDNLAKARETILKFNT